MLARFGPAAPRICARLAEAGIYVRDRSRIHGCEGCVRITTGLVAHTKACIEALEELLCDAR